MIRLLRQALLQDAMEEILMLQRYRLYQANLKIISKQQLPLL
jgi:hypothetical protein